MNVFVNGVGVANRGAELMLWAVLEQVGRRFPDARFSVDPAFGSFEQRAAFGLRSMLRVGKGVRSRFIETLASGSFRNLYGLMCDSEVDVVLDASGFAYGDQWGPEPCRRFVDRRRRWKANDAVVILLPQAFGPFEKADVKRAFAPMLKSVDLIYAREATSFRHVEAIGGASAALRMGHDFTNLVKGAAPQDLKLPDRYAAIVPNRKILEKARTADADAYVRLLADVAERVAKRGVEPVMVLHSTQGDEEIAEAVHTALGRELPCVKDRGGRQLKAVLGNAHLVAGSRFHSLVGALSQGVPCVATSWSHKYEELFREYGCPQCVLPMDVKRSALENTLGELVSGKKRAKVVSRLNERANAFRGDASRMFEEVCDLIAKRR